MNTLSLSSLQRRFVADPSNIRAAIVLMSIQDDQLHVLLRHGAHAWRLPIERVDAEDLDACARQMVAKQAGTDGLFVEQLYTFGRRCPTGSGLGITVSYYACVPWDRAPQSDAPDGTASWFSVRELPPLSGHTSQVIDTAVGRLEAKINYSTIAVHFLPDQFTLSELQSVYEVVLRDRLDKRNFRKRILSLDIISETGELRRHGSHRPARLYRYAMPNDIHYFK